MISVEFAREIHALLIEEFGGKHGGFIGAKCTKDEMFNAISKASGLEKWWATKAEGIR